MGCGSGRFKQGPGLTVDMEDKSRSAGGASTRDRRANGDTAGKRLALKNAPASSRCERRGCKAKPDALGLSYCAQHGREYAEGLR